jgi:hypothetical protein
MHDPVMERASLAVRHDFDTLPRSSEIEVQPARHRELSILADMANRLVPRVQISEPILSRYVAFDSECVLTFSRKQRLLGAIAFLYLNNRGHDALILGQISLARPDVSLLAGTKDEASAIYMWAIATNGRGIVGLGNVAAHLAKPRFVSANYFAQPSTTAGRNLLIATGFKQITSFQPDLWRYERPWNRLLPHMPESSLAARSFADARH